MEAVGFRLPKAKTEASKSEKIRKNPTMASVTATATTTTKITITLKRKS